MSMMLFTKDVRDFSKGIDVLDSEVSVTSNN